METKMRIIYGKWGIDFESPPYMSDRQRVAFISFMQRLLPNIKVVNIQEKKKLGPGGGESKHWTQNELELLLKTDDNDTLAKKLGRTEMSVKMERAERLPEFFAWAQRKGYVVPAVDVDREPLIKKFFEEREK